MGDNHLAIDNIRTLLDWKLLSATVTICVSRPIMMEDLREDYKSVSQDIFDLEKLKIDSLYSKIEWRSFVWKRTVNLRNGL